MGIKLKDILLEGFDRKAVVKRVYPLIVKNLGRARRGTPKVEFHSNIYVRVTGNPDAQGEANPYAEYNWKANEIYLYTPRMTNEKEIIKALLHEYTHATQDPKKHEEYRKKGYKNDPYEKAASKAEKNWRKYLKKNENKDLNECVIAHGVFDDKIILAKNRDRSYKASVRIIREIVKGVEMVYILDDDTDWSEGINEHGIAIVNSALMVNADEKEKKIAKSKGKPSEDGAKIRKALSYKKPSEAIMSVVNYTGEEEDEVGVKGHTFVATPKHCYSIEMTTDHDPVVKKLSKTDTHIRTNHGYDYEDSGYTSGQNKKSSKLRHKRSQNILKSVDTPDGVLDGLSAIQAPDDMRNNPFRDNDEIKNKTEKDILSTTGQILLNVTDLEFVYRSDPDQCDYHGIDDRTPDSYRPKIKIRVQKVINKRENEI